MHSACWQFEEKKKLLQLILQCAIGLQYVDVELLLRHTSDREGGREKKKSNYANVKKQTIENFHLRYSHSLSAPCVSLLIQPVASWCNKNCNKRAAQQKSSDGSIKIGAHWNTNSNEIWFEECVVNKMPIIQCKFFIFNHTFYGESFS